jgi:hypothetical protein
MDLQVSIQLLTQLRHKEEAKAVALLQALQVDLLAVLVAALLMLVDQAEQLLKATQAEQLDTDSADRLVSTAAVKEQAAAEALVQLQVLALLATAVMVELVAQIL